MAVWAWDGQKQWEGLRLSDGYWWRLDSLAVSWRRCMLPAVVETWSRLLGQPDHVTNATVWAFPEVAGWDGTKKWSGMRFTGGCWWRLLTAKVTWPSDHDAAEALVSEFWEPWENTMCKKDTKDKKGKKGKTKGNKGTKKAKRGKKGQKGEKDKEASKHTEKKIPAVTKKRKMKKGAGVTM